MQYETFGPALGSGLLWTKLINKKDYTEWAFFYVDLRCESLILENYSQLYANLDKLLGSSNIVFGKFP
jgi:hypothetical protein